MKKVIINILTIICGLLLAILIIHCQNMQAIGDYEELTAEEHIRLQQQYCSFIERRK